MSDRSNEGKDKTIAVTAQAKEPVRETRRPDKAFIMQLKGFSLTTAEILYRLPDHPSLLQSFLWQDYDLHPRFPKLQEFLDFWSSNLDGALYKVMVAHQALIQPREIRMVSGEFKLN